MNVGANFNNYDIKTAIINFIQIFFIGWFVISSLLFLWSATEYGFEKTVSDISFSLLLSPVFWFFPLVIAVIVSVLRGIKRDSFDITNQDQLVAHVESQRLSNQPLWFKLSVGFFLVIFAYGILKPDTEISQNEYRKVENILARNNSSELQSFYTKISEDGKIMGKELHEFINVSLKTQFGDKID